MWWWFRRKKRSKPAEPETTRGGSTIDRCGDRASAKTPLGLLDAEAASFAAQRERVYEEFFGRSNQVFHQVLPFAPHVDVYTFEPGHAGRDFHTLVTSGMSDRPMNLPPGAADATSRVELILYCRGPEASYAETLHRLAHFPHDCHSWLGTGHTMPNGAPPEPIWGSPALDTFLFLPTIVAPDMTLPDRLKLQGESVEFLWVVPISSAECELKLEEGIDELLDLFDRFEHPHIFDPNRPCYVAAAR